MTILISATNELGQPASLFNTTASIFSTAAFAAVDADNLIVVTDSQARKVWIISRDTEAAFALDAEFLSPQGVAFDSKDRILIADRHAHTIKAFTKQGEFIEDIGRRGVGQNRLGGPLGIVVDPLDGTIIVSEYDQHRLQAFDADGESLWLFGDEGDGDTEFTGPADMVIDPVHRLLWVADHCSGRVRAFKLDNSLDIVYTLTGFKKPHGLTIDARGLLYVTDSRAYHVFERVIETETRAVLYLKIHESAHFDSHPSGIADLGRGEMLVCAGPSVVVTKPLQIADRVVGVLLE